MKSLFEPVNLKAQSHRNPFDLSYQFQNTLPFGALLPCGFWPVNPNDKIRLTNEYQLICDALIRPAFTRMKCHINYYFVPATQIQMSFDNFITGQDTYISSAVQALNVADGSRIPNSLPMFDGTFLSTLFATLAGQKDELGYPMEVGAIRLLDSLGYMNLNAFLDDPNGDITDPSSWTDFIGNNMPEMNFNALACYQKVYYDYFRNPKYEDNDVEAFNLDDVMPGTQAYSARLAKLFKMHYRWAKKDYFMNVQPNTLVSDQQLGYSGLGTPSLTNQGQIFGVPGLLKSEPHVMQNNNTTYTDVSNIGQTTNTGSAKYGTSFGNLETRVSVQNIRTAFAFDRLLRRMREAGADFDKQMLAQFGVAPFDARHGKCYHIGGFVNQLTTNSITNMTNDYQAMQQGPTLGELAGQINFYADNSGKTLEYHVKEMGYIIGVVSISNDNAYQSYRINRYNVFRDRFDFFNPVFEDLGLQPLFKFEMDYTDETSGDPMSPNYTLE